jgi:predicted protein tyrosine phosphatase
MSPSESRPVRVLFVCQFNRSRSATAERVFCKDPRLDVRSAGTSADALVIVNARMLEWADIIFIMDGGQQRWLDERFAGNPALTRIVNLDIADDYTFLDPKLVKLLQERANPHIEKVRAPLNREP